MANNSNSSFGGIGIGGFMFLIFMTLKLTNQIDWSWWWITSPIWIPITVLILFVIITSVVVGIRSR